MPATLALLPSPLLGGAVWGPVADALRARGLPVTVARLPREVGRPASVLAGFVADLRGIPDLVLVPHSNAGLFCPALAEATGAAGTVFVDAALPVTAGETALAPPAFLDFLRGLADDTGVLPPWTRWWDEADLDGLFPDAAWRRVVQETEPRVPLSYFDSTLPVPADWAGRACAYLAFGTAYAEETARARRLGWPVEVMAGRHLELLHRPAAVADAVLGLWERLGP
ncbi:MAG: hypothetical protein ACXVYW_19265 [Oryzihumus sp.]